MPFANLGFTEILVILLLVLLLFGAKRLPEIGASMGKGIREFKRSITDIDRSIADSSREDRDRERVRGAGDPAAPEKPSDDESRPEPKRLLG